ncbi:glycosyltransferase family 4 protein [Spirosoma areae]
MQILFDHQTFSMHNYGGLPRYFAELISGINKTADNSANLPLLFSNTIHLNEAGISTKPFLPGTKIPKKEKIIYNLNKLYNLYELGSKSFDIFHATYYDPYFIPYLKGKPFVVTFLDMIHERFANQFTELASDQVIVNQKKKIADLSDKIIAISESTKNDIVELLHIDPTKIDVVHLGSSLPILPHRQKSKSAISGIPYLLFVGRRGHYKNFFALLKAIYHLLKHYQVKLVCAGGGPLTKEEKELIYTLKVNNLVTYEHIANDQNLQELYKNAIAFVFPTLYEGFGIPILEAFASGCPCVISDRSSLPEVAGDAALYFNPRDESSMASVIEKIILDSELRENLTQMGYNRLNQFSWERTVRETLRVYQDCLINKSYLS